MEEDISYLTDEMKTLWDKLQIESIIYLPNKPKKWWGAIGSSGDWIPPLTENLSYPRTIIVTEKDIDSDIDDSFGVRCEQGYGWCVKYLILAGAKIIKPKKFERIKLLE